MYELLNNENSISKNSKLIFGIYVFLYSFKEFKVLTSQMNDLCPQDTKNSYVLEMETIVLKLKKNKNK